MSRLYEQVADRITELVRNGVYGYGERVPSVRTLSQQLEVSATTVVEAYRLLEDQGLLESRPQSGYYVCRSPENHERPECRCPDPRKPVPVGVGDLIMRVLSDAVRQDVVSFAGADAAPDLLPLHRLQRELSEAARDPAAVATYDLPPGCRELRVQIARRAAAAGCVLSPDQIVLTVGCQEALTLCLRAVCRVGDVVAIESPTFYGQLQAIEALGLKVLEIPSDPVDGMSLAALKLALEQIPVRAVVATPSYNNPTGSCMPEPCRQELVDLLAARDIPLIEDDVYGDLGYELRRAPAAKAYDRAGRVLYCSSFSKTAAPGFRLGWAVPGRYQAQVERLKVLSNLASPTLQAHAMASYLAGSGYERYLRRIQREYGRRVRRLREVVRRSFPEGTRISSPRGGFVLWIELPSGYDTVELYPRALGRGVGYAPGPIFSAARRYRNCLRLTASRCDPSREEALERLGAFFRQQGE
ncbi:MAG: PLP-dependent aminotransferase family protein [Armatimonadetes bacterium]|nr:PLP-dependent aminotransferase family protein [Armatimonadota bacterium]